MTNLVSENVAIVIIGDEILSGRTRDTNFNFISKNLLKYGILVSECRIISDNKNEIISTVNELRKKYKYVITTGGIGPTHDDITSESIADAFEVEIEINKDAYNILNNYYKNIGANFNEVRQRMAKIPSGAKLIKNQISAAPGFKIENVFVLAGVPKIMESMLTEVIQYMEPQEKAINIRIKVMAPEGEIANILEKTIEKPPGTTTISQSGILVSLCQIIKGSISDIFFKDTAISLSQFEPGKTIIAAFI